MFKRILVPTDASEPSRHALSTALELAIQLGAEIELLHVTSMPSEYVGYDIDYDLYLSEDQMAKAAEDILEKELAGIQPNNVTIIKKHLSGHPASAILEEIRRDFDLVVMGSHGHGPLIGIAVGSVSQKILAHARCPVLIVK